MFPTRLLVFVALLFLYSLINKFWSWKLYSTWNITHGFRNKIYCHYNIKKERFWIWFTENIHLSFWTHVNFHFHSCHILIKILSVKVNIDLFEIISENRNSPTEMFITYRDTPVADSMCELWQRCCLRLHSFQRSPILSCSIPVHERSVFVLLSLIFQ